MMASWRTQLTLVAAIALLGVLTACDNSSNDTPAAPVIPAPVAPVPAEPAAAPQTAPETAPTTAPADEAVTQPAAAAAYPLTVCLVSDEKLGGMGEPVIYKHEGREVRFCCKDCIAEFQKDPAKYLAKLDAPKAAAPAAAVDEHAGHNH